ncbi:nuclear transport factor 2 family protein [Paracoccus caeni]|uniref:Nuclear transport factor 2 family protein n=1 Tax=Paracoccus caeni TaxID=657651 RepID=A0A934VW43_9RHOB|nr:nuclear transport factor 2 family protein [Paracoccus caeni]MBK4217636.1 nuclear transport factor 2 family protein [Paracoccus caeni]
MTAIKRVILGGVLAAAMLGQPALAETATRDLVQEEANRELVIGFYNRFFNDHETVEAAEVVAEDYIQHNPQVPDGKAPLVDYFTGYFAENPESKAEIVRSATDGDLVYLHVHSTNGAEDRGTAVVDIFRVEDGMIVEHWDVLQEVPEESANDNTMF